MCLLRKAAPTAIKVKRLPTAGTPIFSVLPIGGHSEALRCLWGGTSWFCHGVALGRFKIPRCGRNRFQGLMVNAVVLVELPCDPYGNTGRGGDQKRDLIRGWPPPRLYDLPPRSSLNVLLEPYCARLHPRLDVRAGRDDPGPLRWRGSITPPGAARTGRPRRHRRRRTATGGSGRFPLRFGDNAWDLMRDHERTDIFHKDTVCGRGIVLARAVTPRAKAQSSGP